MLFRSVSKKGVDELARSESKGWKGVGKSLSRFAQSRAALVSAFVLLVLIIIAIFFLFPWAVGLKQGLFGGFGFLAMMLFLGLLVIGFIYEWKKGALEWE